MSIGSIDTDLVVGSVLMGLPLAQVRQIDMDYLLNATRKNGACVWCILFNSFEEDYFIVTISNLEKSI